MLLVLGSILIMFFCVITHIIDKICTLYHKNWTMEIEFEIICISISIFVNFCVADSIQTVSLPSSDVSVGTTVTPTGWGRPSDSKYNCRPKLFINDIYMEEHHVKVCV